MLLNYDDIEINGNKYQVGIGPIIRGKTQVSFSKLGSCCFANLCVEDDSVVINTGLSDVEISFIKEWVDENRLELWEKAKNVPMPSQEQLRNLVEKTLDDLDELFKHEPCEASAIKSELDKAINAEIKRRENETDDPWQYIK